MLILALVCGALLISGGIGLYFSYQQNKVALASLQHEKALSAAARIEQFVLQIEQQLAYAALPQLGVEGLEQRRIEFLKLLRVVHAVTDITQIDAKGREQLSVSRLKMDEAGTDRDWSQEPSFKNARPGQTWYGPVYFRKETEPYMSIAVRSGGEAGAVTVAEVNLKFIWDVVTRIKVGQKGKAYVVDSTGHLVADPDIGLVLRKTDMAGLEQVKAALKPDSEDALAMLAKDLGGTSVLTAFAPIEPARDMPLQGARPTPLGWKVFVEQPVVEVYQALDATVIRTVAMLVAGLLFSALAAMWLARSMARPISVLQEGAQRIGAGDLDTQIQMKTGDELETLADQFNAMTAQLRESYAGLERKVEERTTALKQTLEQQTAISEILRVISSSPSDVQPVLDAVVERAARICEAQFADIVLADGDRLHFAASLGEIGRPASTDRSHPLNRLTVMGRSIVDRQPVHISDLQDVSAESEFPRGRAMALEYGHRTILAVPLLRENKALGTIVVRRREVRPFEDKYVTLLKTFADQAAIAIENVRLFNETKESLGQQTAISEVLRVISSSPSDVKPVLDAVADRAIRLCDAKAATIYVLEGNVLRRTAFQGPPELLGGETLPYTPESLTGRTIAEGKAIHVPDIEHEQAAYPRSWQAAQRLGNHSMLSVPLMREGKPFGTMFLRRAEVRPFSEKQIVLATTFGDQAAIAIENVRLFNETKEALEQQKASGDVLGAISSSIADTKPVFDKILDSCERLFEGHFVGITVVGDDGRVHLAGYHGPNREGLAKSFPLPVTRESATGMAILDRKLVHFPDVMGAADVPPLVRRLSEANDVRSIIFAPMLWEGRGIGVINVGRQFVGEFTEKQIRLLKTFADQAVIAIQNARLFREIQEKSAQLEVANKHKSDFLANMSHELRTPLNAVIGFSEVLKERMFGDLNDKQLEYVRDIYGSGQHLLSLINDILDLTKVEAGQMSLDLQEFDVPAAVKNCATLIRERAIRNRLKFECVVDPGVSRWPADERKFKQVLINLLSNAVKFTPAGGSVTLHAMVERGWLVVSVRDTGIGIAPGDRAAIFQEFQQLKPASGAKHEGTGLGLSLSRRLVELHHGTLTVESAAGRGSTFTARFPGQGRSAND